MTYVTAGYPKPEDTPDILLGMQKGGAGMFRETIHTPSYAFTERMLRDD